MFSCCLGGVPRQQVSNVGGGIVRQAIPTPGNDIRDDIQSIRRNNSNDDRTRVSWTPECPTAAGTRGFATQSAGASRHGSLSYDDFNVLHYFQGEQCDVLFTSIKFQGPSIATLLNGVLSSMDVQSSVGAGQNDDKSKVFLSELLGTERAQAAEAAVLEGQPFVTVVQKELPVFGSAPPSIGFESCCSSLQHSAAKLAKLALQSEFSLSPSSLSRRATQASLSPAVSKELQRITAERQPQQQEQQQQQQQQQQKSNNEERAAEACLHISQVGLSMQPETVPDYLMLHPPTFQAAHLSQQPLMPRPSMLIPQTAPAPLPEDTLGGLSCQTNLRHLSVSQRPALAPLPEDSSTPNNIQESADRPIDLTASVADLVSPPIIYPLPRSRSTRSSSDPPAASSSMSGLAVQSSSPCLLQGSSQTTAVPVVPSSRFVNRAGLQSACELHISSESSLMDQQEAAHAGFLSSGSGKRTLLQTAGSRKPMSALGFKSKAPTAPSVLHGVFERFSGRVSGEYERTLAMLETVQLEHSRDGRSPSPSNQGLPALTTSASKSATAGGARSAHLFDVGLYIGDPAARERPMLTGPQSSPAACAQCAKPPTAATTAKGSWPIVQGAMVGGPAEAADEEHCRLFTCGSSATHIGQDAQPEGLQAGLQNQIFEVSIRSLPSAQGRRGKAVGMVSIVDITAQFQAQAALMSLAEGQLSLVSSFLPRHAIDFLARRQNNADTIPQNVGKLARSHKMATILFMDICGFTSLSKSVEPREVMEMLNALFSRFDNLTDNYKVHKVETAGDCYIVSSGVLSDETSNGFSCILDHHDHPEVSASRMMEFAKAVLQEMAKVNMPHSSEPVQMRVGIHSGDVTSGIIGTKLPKFSIFGDTMNTTARMESTGSPGRIHVSEAAKGLLPEYAWEALCKINIKGKGMMQTYLWDANRGWSQGMQQQQQQQQLVHEGRERSERPSDGGETSETLLLAIKIIKGLTAWRSSSNSSRNFEQA